MAAASEDRKITIDRPMEQRFSKKHCHYKFGLSSNINLAGGRTHP